MGLFTPNQYPVQLSHQQRQRLEDIAKNGQAPAKKIRHAHVLLLADRGRPGGPRTDPHIADALDRHVNTVARIRKRFVTQGEQPALDRKPRRTPPVPAKIDGRVEAHLVALCCGPAPEGRARWTLQLLADELSRQGLVTQISATAVGRALKKMHCSPGARRAGASPNATGPASSPRWKTSSTCTRPNTAKKSR